MPKRTSFFILLFLSSLILFSLFPGCLPVTPEPEPVTGAVSGYVALPDDTTKVLTGYSPIPCATVTIVDAEGVTHTVLTDENGYYCFNDISIKTNTIINITKDTGDGGKLIFKDMVPLAVSQEEDYDAGIADAESTATALIVEGLIQAGWTQEEIDLEEIADHILFDDLEDYIQQAQNNNQDLTETAITTTVYKIINNIINPPSPEPTPTYTVTFNKNDDAAAGSMTAQTIASGSSANLTACAFTKTGWTFAGWATTSGGAVAYDNQESYTMGTSNVTLYAKWTAIINIAAIPGVTAPVTGATPVDTIIVTAQYTGTVAWSDTPETFAGGTEYTATITLTPKAGFTLTGVTENFFTVAEATTDTNPADSGVVTAEFPETAFVITDTTIIGVTAPVTGAVPDGTIDDSAQYTGTVTWSPTDSPFAGEEVYTATITLTAKSGYTLSGVAANSFTVDGVAATNTTNSGEVTSAAFPATVAAEITAAGVTEFVAPVTGGTAQVFGNLNADVDTYTVTGLTWSPVHATFGGTTIYTATVVLTSASGNKFPSAGIAEPTANVGTEGAGETSGGDVSGNTLSFEVQFPVTATVSIGADCGGGKVAYILVNGNTGYDPGVQHGLIAAAGDQSSGIQWWNGSPVITSATDTEIGTGQANTTVIVTIQGEERYAAQLCDDLTEGGYDDWFLPSLDELNQLYINRVAIGGFAANYYWSSSEYNASIAWGQSFYNGFQSYGFTKDYTYRVRAVRAF